MGEKEWFFFCPRDRKYRNSLRPNRVTDSGFWKATGTDRPIYSTEGAKCIGLKKSLVFYKGRAAKGVKTDWMMHEFRLPASTTDAAHTLTQNVDNAINDVQLQQVCICCSMTSPFFLPASTSPAADVPLSEVIHFHFAEVIVPFVLSGSTSTKCMAVY